MANKLKYMEISYPNFVLGQIIDPEEANQNNHDIVTKVNEFVDEVEASNIKSEIAEANSLEAINMANSAVVTSNEALGNSNIAVTTSSDALAKADAVFILKPDLEQAIIDANDATTRIEDILDGGIFTDVGARTLEGSFISLVDGTITFNIPASLYNPETDYIELSYMGVILESGVNYNRQGRQITLLFELKIDEVIRYKTTKNVMINPNLSDGALIINSTITDDKLDDGVGMIKDRVNTLSTDFIDFKNNTNIKLNNYNSYASNKDDNGIYTIVDYKRADDTLYMKSTLSNADAEGNYQTMTLEFYNDLGDVVINTVTWAITYDVDGDIANKVVSV